MVVTYSSIVPELTEAHPKFELPWYGVRASKVAGAEAGAHLCLSLPLSAYFQSSYQT